MADLKACLATSLPGPLDYYRHAARAGAELGRGQGTAAEDPVAVPTLYLHGADDGCIGPEIMEGQARYFAAGLRERVLPGVGHFLHLERPAEVEAEIVAWLLDADQR